MPTMPATVFHLYLKNIVTSKCLENTREFGLRGYASHLVESKY